MFAKGVGIIGIGVATASCETLPPGDSKRVWNFSREKNSTEWSVPVRWLTWTDEAGAYRWRGSPNFTFWDISAPRYQTLRGEVRAHFLAKHDDR
jgi:hypothetical protein